MIPPPVILTVLLSRPAYQADRGDTREARIALLTPVAEAISRVSRTPEDVAFLIAQGEHETHFARYVLENRCKDGPRGAQCDPDRDGNPRARGPWQVWRNACRAEDLTGQARCVLGTAHLGLQRCASWSGAFGALTGKWACVEKPERVQTMRAVLARMGR